MFIVWQRQENIILYLARADLENHYWFQHQQNQQKVVILIDEYDKPIINIWKITRISRILRGLLHEIREIRV